MLGIVGKVLHSQGETKNLRGSDEQARTHPLPRDELEGLQ